MECPICLLNWVDVIGVIHIMCSEKPHSICRNCYDDLVKKNNAPFVIIFIKFNRH